VVGFNIARYEYKLALIHVLAEIPALIFFANSSAMTCLLATPVSLSLSGLVNGLAKSNLSGCELAGKVEIERTEIFDKLNPTKELPLINMVKASEVEGFDSLFERKTQVCVSPRAWDFLKTFKVLFCDVIC
jgi:hypothetical protein